MCVEVLEVVEAEELRRAVLGSALVLVVVLPWEMVTSTGILLEAAVLGLRSWVGDGARLREAVWMVSDIWRGMEEAMTMTEQDAADENLYGCGRS